MRNHILFMALSVFSAQAEISRLAALSMIETGNDDHAVGGAGEVSRFQIKPWIWRQYNQSGAYTNRRISTEVAGNHLAALRDTFHKCSGRAPSDFDIYVLWNAGPTYYARIGFAKSRVHPVIRDRARRFANLCQINDATMAQASLPKVPVVPQPPAVNANAPGQDLSLPSQEEN